MKPKGVVLSFDPGMTTGYAAVTSSGQILQSFDIPAEAVLDGSFAGSLTDIVGVPFFAVMERTPVPTGSKMNQMLAGVIRSLIFWLGGEDQIVFVQPGTWKNSKYGRKNIDYVTSKHQADAVRLAFYFWEYLAEEVIQNRHLAGSHSSNKS